MAPIPCSIPSCPFSTSSEGGNSIAAQSVLFAIPAGTWASASWSITGNYSTVSASIGVVSVNTGAHFATLAPFLGQSPFTLGTTATAAQIADINTAAGGNLAAEFQAVTTGSPVTFTITSFTLTLVGTGIGGNPVAYTFTETVIAGVCYALVTITLLDNAGNAANVPAGQQQLMLITDNNIGTFNPPNPLVITAGNSSVQTKYSIATAGPYTLTVMPAAGPLTASVPYPAAQSIVVSISCGSGDVLGCLCALTRPNYRDAIRRRLYGYAPIDNGLLIPGLEPVGASFPSNAFANQCINDGIRELNRLAKFNTTVNLSVTVPPMPANTTGPQFIPLQGIIGCPTQSALNSVRRMVYTDANGTPTYRVDPTTFTLEDRLENPFDNVPPNQPVQFFIVGYMLGLLPGSVNGGTLSLYAGTAVPQFCSDADTIAELSTDYQEIIEYAALMKVCESPMGRRLFGDNSLALYAGKFNDVHTGWPSIAGLAAEATEEYTPSFGYVSNRQPSRLGNAFGRRWGRGR